MFVSCPFKVAHSFFASINTVPCIHCIPGIGLPGTRVEIVLPKTSLPSHFLLFFFRIVVFVVTFSLPPFSDSAPARSPVPGTRVRHLSAPSALEIRRPKSAAGNSAKFSISVVKNY